MPLGKHCHPPDGRSFRCDRSDENVRKWNEPGSLKSPTGCDVRRVATRAWNGPDFVADALQFLDEVRTQAAPPKRLSHVHIDIAVGPIVVKQNPAFRSDVPVQFEEPLASTLTALHATPDLFLRRHAAQDCAIGRMAG